MLAAVADRAPLPATTVGEHARAVELAERRLGRPLSLAERNIDLVALDRLLAKAKARLARLIAAEQRRAVRAHFNRERPIRLRVTPEMQAVLNGLYRAGQAHARREIRSLGRTPTVAHAEYADPGDAATRLRARLAAQLVAFEAKLHNKAVAVDISAAASDAATRAVMRQPGALDVASRVVSSGLLAGIGDVYSQNTGLFAGWQYSAVMDAATCGECAQHDGETYDSWDAAVEVLPDGGPNPDCDGDGRCRCRLVPNIDGGAGGGAAGPDGGAPSDIAPPEDTVAGAPTAGGPPLPGVRPQQEFADIVERKQRQRHDFYYRHHGMGSVDEYRQAVTDRLREVTRDAEVRVRVTPNALRGVLNDGRFKSQFETQTSGGALDETLRRTAEEKFFSYPPDLPVADRPIYGYLSGNNELGVVENYGSIMVRLREDVRARSTFSMEDSLGSEFTFENHPVPLNEPDYRAVFAARDPLADPGSGVYQANPGIYERFAPHTYAEAQIHGGVGVGDVEEVVWTQPLDKLLPIFIEELKARLGELGIRWRVVPDLAAA